MPKIADEGGASLHFSGTTNQALRRLFWPKLRWPVDRCETNCNPEAFSNSSAGIYWAYEFGDQDLIVLGYGFFHFGEPQHIRWSVLCAYNGLHKVISKSAAVESHSGCSARLAPPAGSIRHTQLLSPGKRRNRTSQNAPKTTSPVMRLIRWDEKAGLQRDAIRSQ